MRVVRLAAGVFAITPLQHWLNGIGLAMILPVVSGQGWSAPLAIIGLIFLAIVPVFLGGPAIRVIAAQRGFRLRPAGPQQLFAAATLAIAVSALFATSIAMLAMASSPRQGVLDFGPTFVVVCGSLTLAWAYTFAMIGSRLLLCVGLAAIFFVRHWVVYALRLPEPKWLLAGAALAAWAWVAYLLMRPRGVTWRPLFNPGVWQAGDSPKDLGRDLTPWAGIRLYLMGTTSYWPFLAPAATLLVFVLVGSTSLLPFALPWPFLVLIAQVSLISGGQAGLALTRRARYLWLRRGADRKEAFETTERTCLFGFVLSSGATSLVLLGVAAFVVPRELWAQAGVYWAVQCLLALCSVYLGLFLTRGWTGAAIVGGIGMWGLWFACLLGPRPGSDDASLWARILVPGLIILAVALRIGARWRWRRIDWLLLRPQRAGVQRA